MEPEDFQPCHGGCFEEQREIGAARAAQLAAFNESARVAFEGKAEDGVVAKAPKASAKKAVKETPDEEPTQPEPSSSGDNDA